MNLRKILTYLAIAFVIWFVIEEPTTAGGLVRNIGHLLSVTAHGVTKFIASI